MKLVIVHVLGWALSGSLLAATPTTAPTAARVTMADLSFLAATSSVASTVELLRVQTLLYAFQHHERFPSLEELKAWNVFLKFTNADGDLLAGKGSGKPYFGPYISQIPVNALTGKSDVCDATALVPTAGWAIQMRAGRPLWLAVVPDAGIPLIRELVANHVAVICPETRMPAAKRPSLAAPANLQAAGVASLARTRVAELNSVVSAYSMDHNFSNPRLTTKTGWDPLLAGPMPYLQQVPENPYSDGTALSAKPTHADGQSGWEYNEELGSFLLIVPADLTVLSPLREEDVERPSK